MSGYLFSINNADSFDLQVKRFKKIYTVKDFELHCPSIQLADNLCLIPWFYGNADQPDLFWTEIGGRYHVLLEGYLTKPVEWQVWLTEWQKNGRGIQELDGSFSLVIHDTIERSTTLISDRFNSRPLFYASAKDRLTIGNFPLPVAAVHGDYTFDLAGLWALMMTSRPVGCRTLFQAVRSVPAGSLALFRDGKDTIKKWFEIKYRPNSNWSRRVFAKNLAESLEHSASKIRQTSPDLALFLSGGMDSRLAAAALGPVHMVTLISSPNMSSRIARKVAMKLGAEHELVLRDNTWYLDFFKFNSLLAGGSYNITHGHFTRYLVDSQLNHPKRCYLLGDLLENFNKNYYRLPQCADSFEPENVPDLFCCAFAFSSRHVEFFRKIFRNDGKLLEQAWRQELVQVARAVDDVSDDPGDKWNALFRWSNNAWCPTNFMLESIKPFAGVRNLMFDNELFDLLLGMPSSYRDGRMHALVLKYLNPGLLTIPNSNYWLPPFMPTVVLNAAKTVKPWLGKWKRYRQGSNFKKTYSTHGSWHMLNHRFRHDKPHRDYLVERSRSSRFDSEFFDQKEIVRIRDSFIQGDDSLNHEISLIVSLGELLDQMA